MAIRHLAGRALTLACALAAFMASPTPAAAQERGNLDHFVLALSWSPTHCDSPEGHNDHRQCAPGRRYAFVVHGLWPQYRRGWPQFCNTAERWVPDETIRAMLDIMPSKRLVIHQWKKHGACSGMSQRDYFAAVRAIFAQIKVPARYAAPASIITTTPQQLAADFLKTNYWMRPDMLQVTCGNRRDRARLDELRLCLTRNLEPRACGINQQPGCRAQELVMPPVR